MRLLQGTIKAYAAHGSYLIGSTFICYESEMSVKNHCTVMKLLTVVCDELVYFSRNVFETLFYCSPQTVRFTKRKEKRT